MSAFVRLQKILPQHGLSRAIGRLAASEAPWVRGPLIRAFAKAYDVDMAQAERPDLADYRSFNDFFSRALTPDARPIDPAPEAIVSPADGAVSQTGTIREGKLLQAKGIQYSFRALADVCAWPSFEGGAFATVYLSPSDYHRVHLPLAGRLVRTVAIPGKLFSVNATTEAGVQGLFAVNERLVMEFETEHGRMLVIMVGAMVVASIETVWDGPASPYRQRQITEHDLAFETGAEIGRFLLGSSVVLAFEKDRAILDPALAAGTVLRMGERIGTGA
ncbi:archaetidylserine decarboxylase [Rubricoccus marinus]|uniref:Phosphatidylserine decarboxylase proenzyme n=1 Tax=Rubricoccus marinus TaxID=716817 RepID=A0A259U0M9_9BACT|nr:archaetidylserine decarboxylase [Rubricoccus marinus]OZC03552.1 phosphatidylserine decarboxylase [Rubricoccus marinus]